MKGQLKCTACGHVFDVKQATFTFDLDDANKQGSIMCPKCQSDAVEPA